MIKADELFIVIDSLHPDWEEMDDTTFEDAIDVYSDVIEKAKKKDKPFAGYNPKKHSRTGGMSAAARSKYNRENNANVKPPVTESNPKGKKKKRKDAFCARMSKLPGATTKVVDGKKKKTPKGAALSKWKCRKGQLEKGIDPVINPVHRGGVEAHVDLKAQMAAEDSVKGGLLYKDMHMFMSSVDDYDTRKGYLHTEDSMYDVELYKKAPNQYSCVVRKSDDGALLTEINDQTLEIICQLINSKLGTEDCFFYPNLEKDEDLRDMLEQDDERLTMNPMTKDVSPADDEALEEMIESAIEVADSEQKKLTIEMDDKEICIKIRKSEDGVVTEKEIIEKSQDEKEKEEKPVDAENTKPKTEVASAEEMGIEDSGKSAEMTGRELADKDDKASGEELPKETKDISAEGDGDDQVEEGMGENIEDLEFVKTSEFEGGQQHWYRDRKTGKIVEKDTAPMGEESAEGSSDLAAKVEMVLQKLDSLLGQEEGAVSQEAMADEADDEAVVEESEESEDEGEEITEDEFDAMVDETAEETQKEQSQASFNGDGTGKVDEDADRGEDKDDVKKAKDRCWDGYKPTPGKKPYSEGSCMKKTDKEKMKKKCGAIAKALKEKYPQLEGEALSKAIVKSYKLMEKAQSCAEEVKEHEDKMHSPAAHMKEHKEMEEASKKKFKEKGKVAKSFDKMPPVLDTMSAEEIQDRDKEIKDMDAYAKEKEAKFLSDFSYERDHDLDKRKKQKKMKKSRLGRMWKVFNIDMPEDLEGEENIAKANEGIQKLQKCIMKQGKDEAEANKVVNRAIIEKYDLLTKGNKFFANEKIWKGGNYVYDGKEATMENLEQDMNNRFSVKEYVAESEQLDALKTGDTMAKSVQDVIDGEKPEWDGFKEYEEKVEKSEPEEHEVIAKSDSDARFAVKEYEGKEENLVKERETGINDAIQKSIDSKPEELTFGDRYQTYDEDKTRMAKSRQTEAEEKAAEFDKRIWGEGLESDGEKE